MNREDLLSSKGSSRTNQICQFKSWNTAVEQLITKHRDVLQINSELKKSIRGKIDNSLQEKQKYPKYNWLT